MFERVIMNEGRGLKLPDGRPVCDGACISFAGQTSFVQFAVTPPASGVWSADSAMYGKLGAANECQRARNDVTNACYGGISNGHEEEDQKTADIIASCVQLIQQRCN